MCVSFLTLIRDHFEHKYQVIRFNHVVLPLLMMRFISFSAKTTSLRIATMEAIALDGQLVSLEHSPCINSERNLPDGMGMSPTPWTTE